MSNWSEFFNKYASGGEVEAKALMERMKDELDKISNLRSGRVVVIYGSAFLQNPNLPITHQAIVPEDINGFMNCVYGTEFDKGLSLILHTPGGQPDAAETIVNYLRSKFSDFEVIVPTYAMSAGTMIALAADRIVMGRQSQLGPIDPHMQTVHGTVSAHAVLSQFERAKGDVAADPGAAAVWAPILSALGPSRLQEAANALAYGFDLVTQWLTRWMFNGTDQGAEQAQHVAQYLNNAELHGSHSRRVDAVEARELGITIEQLEDRQELQDAVLGAYHAMTVAFEHAGITKMIFSSSGSNWMKASPTASHA